MRVKCSWCQKTLVFDDNDESVSHGVCLTCAIKVLEETGIDPTPFFASYLRMKQPRRIYSDQDDDDE